MSFGFDDEGNEQRSNPIRQAIYTSMTTRETDNILYFAATGNDGANRGKVMFPAKHELVIPIYGTDAKGAFLDSLHPTVRRDGSAVFGTLAQDVPCMGLADEGEVTMTGTSFATAIAAGFAGMLLEYVRIMEKKRQTDGGSAVAWSKRLGTKRGMLALFSTISEPPPDRRYYLHPASFFAKSEDVRVAEIIKAYHEAR